MVTNGYPELKIRPILRWLVGLRDSPEAIGRGVAIGVFVAFTPTIGLQMVIATFLATVFNGNRPAAIVPVWITNPLTIPPLFALTYRIGSLFWDGPPVGAAAAMLRTSLGQVARLESWSAYDQFVLFAGVGLDVLAPLAIGGLLVGSVLGVASYVLTVSLVTRARQRRRATRRSRAASANVV